MHRTLLPKLSSIKDPRKRKVIFYYFINQLASYIQKTIRLSRKTAGIAITKCLPEREATKLINRLKHSLNTEPKTRRFLNKDYDIPSFFGELNRRDINYVVLRWFEKLPHVKKDEDIDLLISDTDIEKISDLFSYDSTEQKFDIYSVTGLPGASYNDIPYYPPHLAQKILDNRVCINDLYYIPNPEQYFFSFCYHVIFHKGQASGLGKTRKEQLLAGLDHDYYYYIERAARKANIPIPENNFEKIYSCLVEENWIPELDTMRILAKNDQLLSNLLPSKPPITEGGGQLMVFVIREWAIKHGKLETIKSLLKSTPLTILETKFLDPQEQYRTLHNIRGGQWRKGPFAISGGPPKALIVCYDYHPIKVSSKKKVLYPYVQNEHVFQKHHIRNHLNAELPIWKHTNCIHSADDEIEAIQYLEEVSPEFSREMIQKAIELDNLYRTNYKVLYLYPSYRSRSKIEKINFDGQVAIKKTFKFGEDRFAQREIFACGELSKDITEIPPLLASTKNHIIIPFYENVLEGKSEFEVATLLKPYAKQVLTTLKKFYELGYALMGFHPGNIILTPSGDIRIIDFEFLHKYETKPESFLLSWDINGHPDDFKGDVPISRLKNGHTYENTWQSIFGPKSELL